MTPWDRDLADTEMNARSELDRCGRLEFVRCDLCGSDDSHVFMRGTERRHHLSGEFTFVRCARCELVYLNPRPSSEALQAYYPTDYSPYARPRGFTGWLSRLVRSREVGQMKRALVPGARVLEVGCAAGDLLVPMRRAGFDVTGVEVSEHAAHAARTVHRLEVHTGVLADAPLAKESFDAVIMRNVIEHLPSPSADLMRAKQLLRPGGLLFVKTDNVASLDRRVFGKYWYGFDFPRHLVLFSTDTLKSLVRQTGFTRILLTYSLVPTHWILSLRYTLAHGLPGAALSALISVKNPALLVAALVIALVQKAARDSGRFGLMAMKPKN